MNRLLGIAALSIGGLSFLLVCFVGVSSLRGRDASRIVRIGRQASLEAGALERAGSAPGVEPGAAGDAAVVAAGVGLLSTWTLPSPYSARELEALAGELEARSAALREDERELERRLSELEQLRLRLERLRDELTERELELEQVPRAASVEGAHGEPVWAAIAGVLETIDAPGAAARKLQEFEPAEAARILRAFGDEQHAGEVLNAVGGERWKEYVAAYSAERARTDGEARR